MDFQKYLCYKEENDATKTHTLYVVDKFHEKALSEFVAEGSRVGMQPGAPPFVIFMTKTKLEKAKHACCGHPIIVKKKTSNKCLLGFIFDLRRKRTSNALVAIWNGRVSAYPEYGIPVPSFLFLSPKTCFSTFEQHFDKVVVDASEDTIIFVEQVNGPRFYQPSYSALTVDKDDGCFQNSPDGAENLIDCEIPRTTDYMLANVPAVDHSLLPGHTKRKCEPPRTNKSKKLRLTKNKNIPAFCCGPNYTYDKFGHHIYFTTMPHRALPDDCDGMHLVPFVGENPIQHSWLKDIDGNGKEIKWDHDMLFGSHPNTILMAYVSKEQSKMLLQLYGAPVSDYNQRLMNMTTVCRRFSLIDARESGGTRLVLVNPQEEKNVMEHVANQATIYGKIKEREIWRSKQPFRGSNVEIGFGVVVSRVEMMPKDSGVTLDEADLVRNAHSESNNDNSLQVDCLKAVNRLSGLTDLAHFNLDPCLCEVVAHVLGYKEETPVTTKNIFCEVELDAQAPVSLDDSPSAAPSFCWGFASCPHVDANTILKETEMTKVINYTNLHSTSTFSKVQEHVAYMTRLIKMHGGEISVPKLCGYEFVGQFFQDVSNDESDVHLLFAFPGVDVCFRLGSSQVHQFHGGHIEHCTPIPIVVREGRVYMHGRHGGRIFSWGSGDDSKPVAERACKTPER